MPMGEKIEHPNTPSGHPGIDFGLSNITDNIPYIASMDGTISKVTIYDSPDRDVKDKKMLSVKMADVVIQNGPYQTVYASLDGSTLPENIREGNKIKQGDVVGYGNFNEITSMGTRGEMIHWEFGSTSPIIDRFCPLSYFTTESRNRIEEIWSRTNLIEMKAKYPLICNGDYEGKEEK
jgi:murein DD-endopeptidase MepM/ murein hydrolase activator NlpD